MREGIQQSEIQHSQSEIVRPRINEDIYVHDFSCDFVMLELLIARRPNERVITDLYHQGPPTLQLCPVWRRQTPTVRSDAMGSRRQTGSVETEGFRLSYS